MNKLSEIKIVEWFLRISLSAGLLSAVADRFGLWDKAHSSWGNWENFVAYTQKLNPFVSASLIQSVAGAATFLEIAFALGLLFNFKISLIARATGCLFLLFALAMSFSNTIKAPLDYSVFCDSAAAFALSILSKRNANKDLI